MCAEERAPAAHLFEPNNGIYAMQVSLVMKYLYEFKLTCVDCEWRPSGFPFIYVA